MSKPIQAEVRPDPIAEAEERRRLGRRVGAIAGIVLFGALVYGGVEFGPPVVVLLLAATALVGVVAAFWGSVRALIGETRLSGADAFAIGAPRAEEEQKRAVLRALKDLEFERSVGKISDEDYGVLVTRYREDAKRLLRLIDQASAEQRQRAEVLVDSRLRLAGVKPVQPKEGETSVPAFEPIADDKPAEEKTTDA